MNKQNGLYVEDGSSNRLLIGAATDANLPALCLLCDSLTRTFGANHEADGADINVRFIVLDSQGAEVEL